MLTYVVWWFEKFLAKNASLKRFFIKIWIFFIIFTESGQNLIKFYPKNTYSEAKKFIPKLQTGNTFNTKNKPGISDASLEIASGHFSLQKKLILSTQRKFILKVIPPVYIPRFGS